MNRKGVFQADDDIPGRWYNLNVDLHGHSIAFAVVAH